MKRTREMGETGPIQSIQNRLFHFFTAYRGSQNREIITDRLSGVDTEKELCYRCIQTSSRRDQSTRGWTVPIEYHFNNYESRSERQESYWNLMSESLSDRN